MSIYAASTGEVWDRGPEIGVNRDAGIEPGSTRREKDKLSFPNRPGLSNATPDNGMEKTCAAFSQKEMKRRGK